MINYEALSICLSVLFLLSLCFVAMYWSLMKELEDKYLLVQTQLRDLRQWWLSASEEKQMLAEQDLELFRYLHVIGKIRSFYVSANAELSNTGELVFHTRFYPSAKDIDSIHSHPCFYASVKKDANKAIHSSYIGE